MFAMAAADGALDPEAVWEAMEARGIVHVPLAAPRPDRPMVACHVCGLVSARLASDHGQACPRCGAALHLRKPNGFARSWALLLAAAVLYLPANAYPVMTVVSLGAGSPDTILSGVVHLAEAGMWPLATLVFFASIAVPVLKLVGLAWLLVAAQRGWAGWLRGRTSLYRLVEAVGRWSMIDLFMVSILAALVRLGNLATIEAGVGAVAFTAVVILTILAAMTFDPRTMWDAAEQNEARHA
jgi:paraquat-inducible protein A